MTSFFSRQRLRFCTIAAHIGCIVSIVLFPGSVSAGVTQTPITFTHQADVQTVTFTFHNTTGQTVTELNAYADQTYIQMSDHTASLGSCATATFMDVGNIRFSDCSIDPDASVQGSFSVRTPNGVYTEADLSMNYTYGDASNEVYVTVSAVSVSVDATPTPTSGTSQSNTTVVVTATPQPTIRPTSTPVPDRVGPVIRVTTDITKPFAAPPIIRGSVSDGSGIRSVSYSVDGGKNFSPVDSLTGKTVNIFSFTPYVTLDDNYVIVVRGVDGAGNATVQSVGTLVIDRMPPKIGAVLISLGSLGIDEKNGVISLLSGIPYHIALSAVGGPITMRVKMTGQSDETVITKNRDTGLWEGTVMVHSLGDIRMSVTARDGAENTVTHEIATIRGVVGGVVVSDDHMRLSDVNVRVFVKNSKGIFVQWNGAEFGQKARMMTDSEGRYAGMLPSGTYYIEYEKNGYQLVRTRIFTFEKASIISSDVSMHPRRGIWVWKHTWFIPFFDSKTQTIDIHAPDEGFDENSLSSNYIGEILPYVPFIYNGNSISYLSFRGKPTLITFLTLWSPTAIAQLRVINRLAENTNIHVLGVFSQETDSSVAVMAKRGLYRVSLVADPDGIASEAISLHHVPMHVIVDRTGIVRHVYTGFMDEIALQDALVK